MTRMHVALPEATRESESGRRTRGAGREAERQRRRYRAPDGEGAARNVQDKG